MSKKFISFIVCIFLQYNVLGKECKFWKQSGIGYFMIGRSIIDLDELNAKLKEHNYSGFRENFISVGGGGYGKIGKIIIGGQGCGLIGSKFTTKRDARDYEYSINGGYGLFNLGYIVYSIGNLTFYPILGIGGGGLSLKIIEKKIGSFDEILDNPNRMMEISSGGLLVGFSIGTNYLLKFKKESGPAFGFRVGYNFAPIKGNWVMDGINILDAPKIGITGPYIYLCFGGGYK